MKEISNQWVVERWAKSNARTRRERTAMSLEDFANCLKERKLPAEVKENILGERAKKRKAVMECEV